MPTRPTLTVDQVAPLTAGWDAVINNATGQLATFVSDQPVAPKVYTIASGADQLPAAASFQYCIAMVSDAASGKRPDVVSDGTHWLYSDGSTAL